MNYGLRITHGNGVPFLTPKWFTGLMLERWPEYLNDPSRAFGLRREQAVSLRQHFSERGLTCELVPLSEEP